MIRRQAGEICRCLWAQKKAPTKYGCQVGVMGSEHKAGLHLKKEALEIVYFNVQFALTDDSTPALL